MMNLSTPRPCHTRSDDQHSYLAGIIGVEVDTEAGGLVGRCKVQVAIVTDGGNVTASYLVASNSDPGLWYALARTDKGNIFCACKGYEMRGRCSHLENCDEAPAPAPVVVLDFQPFRVGDPVVYTSPRDGATVSGQVAAVAGERVTISTPSGAYRNFPIAHVTPWQPRTVERGATRLEDTAAYRDLFGSEAA
jgi:hypothetical protein